ncbi:DUF6090 family protein [Gillisia sp. M10.2A]|uniref:DUF6090 family protein n=1 Tax=Gillisia lutea TaxID=2909668 RepID=A0ABS9EG90_9FLAO|nr:DUF6090 family protein [Gillisia lutea]MCF4101907.1 DUF6090 family protein [Gillisia lutea]
MKFFRKIRQKLFTESKFSKYLIYAIGEIILVVIGILIALTINNYNQNQLIKAKEQKYLKGLKEEFQTSKLKLTELMDVNKNNYEGAKQIIVSITKNDPPTEIEFSQLIYKTFSFDISFNPNNSLLSEMINSGSLKDVNNNVLRRRLTNWLSTLEDISKQESELGNQREKVLDLLRSDEYSLRTILDLTDIYKQVDLPKGENHISNLDLLNSKEFENNVLMFILTSYATQKAHYQPLMDEIDSIISLIDTEIKNEG